MNKLIEFFLSLTRRKNLVIIVVVVAVVAAAALLLRSKYKADEVANGGTSAAITPAELLRIKNEAISLKADIEKNPRKIAKTTSILPGGNPSDADVQAASDYMNQKYLDTLDNTIKSISADGNIVSPSTTPYDIKNRLLDVQKETLFLAGAPTKREQIVAFFTRKDLGAEQQKWNDISKDIDSIVVQIKGYDTNPLTQDEMRSSILSAEKPFVDKLRAAMDSSDDSKLNNSVIKSAFNNLITANQTLYSEPAASLEPTEEEEFVDILIEKVTENIVSDTTVSDTNALTYGPEKATLTATAGVTTSNTTLIMSLQQEAVVALKAAQSLPVDGAANSTPEQRTDIANKIYTYLVDVKGLPALTKLPNDQLQNFLSNNTAELSQIMLAHSNKATADPKNLARLQNSINLNRAQLIIAYRKLTGGTAATDTSVAPPLGQNELNNAVIILPNGAQATLTELSESDQKLYDSACEVALAYGYTPDIKLLLLNDFLARRADFAKYGGDWVKFLKENPMAAKTYYGDLIGGTLKTSGYMTGLVINPKTGVAEYKTTIKHKTLYGTYETVGYISFDPTGKTVDAQLPVYMGGKQVTLYSDPRTGDVYVEYSNRSILVNGKIQQTPLLSEFRGNLKLMSVTVSEDGHFGGSFQLFHRLFDYNPNSKSFEIAQSLGHGRGQVFIDSKGNVRGQVNLLGKGGNSINNGTMFFDRNGNFGFAYELKSGTSKSPTGERSTYANISFNQKGQIAGTLDIGKIAGMSSIMVGFDKSGLSGLNIAMGSWGSSTFGLGIGKDGSLSFGGFIPTPLGPIPITAGQDEHGNVRLSWPGGSMHLFGNENRPLDAPKPEVDKTTGNLKGGCIYFRHSFKKGLKTIRVYQSPCDTIDPAEQTERGNMIFKVFNELLKRNPSVGEFLNWYFYAGHELYSFDGHTKSKDYRMDGTEATLKRNIVSGYSKVVPDQFKFPENEEYAWIQAGKDALNAPTRPTDLLTTNPFDSITLANAQAAATSGGTVATTTNGTTTGTSTTTNLVSTAIQQFGSAIIQSAAQDSQFKPAQ